MSFFKIQSFSSFIFITSYFSLLFASFPVDGTNFTVENKCSYTVWAAAVPGISKKLEPGESLSFKRDSNYSKVKGSIWARTNCYFNAEGTGQCDSGDCGGLLDCGSSSYPAAPVTLAQYILRDSNNMDSFYISLIKGFNVPLEFRGTSSGCTERILCRADINSLCPTELRDPGGCNHPCTVFSNDQFCCNNIGNCEPTAYSKFFKNLCPNAYTYRADDSASVFTCPTGNDYQVVFCPSNSDDIGIAPHSVFQVRNNCPNTVWAAAVPGGGKQLDQGQTWIINAQPGTTQGRIWARTNCQFDGSGRGKCQTGDCNGLLACQSYGAPPSTLAEYALKQFNDMDFIDMSNIDGFNVPMEFSSVSSGCNRVIKWTGDIIGQCPNKLKVPGGCNGPCPAFKTEEHCCNSGNCRPTNYSRFFKEKCPDVYSYPKDDATSTFTCPSGTNYKIVFCPNS